MLLIANNPGNNRIPPTIPAPINTQTTALNKSNGLHTRYNSAIPTVSRIKVTDVDSCSCGIPLKLLYTVNIATRRKSVNAAGSALIATFTRNLPFIRLLFLCIASKNPGAPIVNAPSRDSCVGYNGYLCPTISVNNAKSIENIFFTRNSEGCPLDIINYSSSFKNN